jgi:hypothetical protein
MNFAAGMQIGGQDATFGGMRNRIINGDMRIDQRNAGAAITQTVTQNYTVDRWWVYGDVTSKFTLQRNAGSVTPPSGFTNYYGITVASAYTPTTGQNFNLTQYLEGFNVADLDFGKATAKTVTASFWIRSSLTGIFGGTLGNGLGSRSYVFSFTINSSNTWEYKTITIPGDTSGTWNTDNNTGMSFTIALGNHSGYLNTPNSAWVAGDYRGPTSQVNLVSNAGATMYVTGVQLEKGSAASAFEYRQFGQELVLCQRYFQIATRGTQGANYSADTGVMPFYFPVQMRANPSAGFLTGSTASIDIIGGTQSGSVGASGANGSPLCFNASITGLSGRTAGIPIMYVGSNLFFSAEL